MKWSPGCKNSMISLRLREFVGGRRCFGVVDGANFKMKKNVQYSGRGCCDMIG